MTVYALRFGSSRVSSSSISVALDIPRFASKLPRLPHEVQRILINNRDNLNTLHSVVVRKEFVIRGLLYKIQNDASYREIRVDTSLVELLPENVIGKEGVFIVSGEFLLETISHIPDISDVRRTLSLHKPYELMYIYTYMSMLVLFQVNLMFKST